MGAVNLDLSRDAEPLAIEHTWVDVLSAAEREEVTSAWLARMCEEHISARIFAGLIPQLMAAGVSPRIQADVADMIAEELVHARFCAGIVTALGAKPIAPLPQLPEVPKHEDAGPVEALLRNLMSISCLSETIACAHIEAERLEVGPEPLREVLRLILADEVGHARLGWRVLDELAPGLDDATRERLNAYLVYAFQALFARHLHADDVGTEPASPAAQAVGVCDIDLMREILLDTVAEVIIPGLEAHGFAAERAATEAWRSLYGGARASA